MSRHEETLQGMFQELKLVSEKILALPLDHEDSMEQLGKFQAQQKELQESIQTIRSTLPSKELTGKLKSMISECLFLEQQVQLKLKTYHAELSEMILKINTGHKVKNLYKQAYAQMDGYFVDKHN